MYVFAVPSAASVVHHVTVVALVSAYLYRLLCYL